MRIVRMAILFVADEADALVYRVTKRHSPWSDWVDDQILGHILVDLV